MPFPELFVLLSVAVVVVVCAGSGISGIVGVFFFCFSVRVPRGSDVCFDAAAAATAGTAL